jgi:hypothetical protein
MFLLCLNSDAKPVFKSQYYNIESQIEEDSASLETKPLVAFAKKFSLGLRP